MEAWNETKRRPFPRVSKRASLPVVGTRFAVSTTGGWRVRSAPRPLQRRKGKKEVHNASLANHQYSLENHAQAIRQLQEHIGKLQAEQQESVRQLQRLSTVYENLQPLLTKLNLLLTKR